MKRGAGVKDSGSILPRHVGMLDRINAMLVAVPVVWAFRAWQLMQQHVSASSTATLPGRFTNQQSH
ncbi:MAG: phosphatidate cytidylyltransferase [Terriglobales bacterium]